MSDSHQRLSDVADNTVCYRDVVQSHTGQGDNLSMVSCGAGDSTSSSVRSQLGRTVVSAFQNDLNASVELNQEELLLIVVASGQNAAVESEAATRERCCRLLRTNRF